MKISIILDNEYFHRIVHIVDSDFNGILWFGIFLKHYSPYMLVIIMKSTWSRALFKNCLAYCTENMELAQLKP